MGIDVVRPVRATPNSWKKRENRWNRELGEFAVWARSDDAVRHSSQCPRLVAPRLPCRRCPLGPFRPRGAGAPPRATTRQIIVANPPTDQGSLLPNGCDDYLGGRKSNGHFVAMFEDPRADSELTPMVLALPPPPLAAARPGRPSGEERAEGREGEVCGLDPRTTPVRSDAEEVRRGRRGDVAGPAVRTHSRELKFAATSAGAMSRLSGDGGWMEGEESSNHEEEAGPDDSVAMSTDYVLGDADGANLLGASLIKRNTSRNNTGAEDAVAGGEVGAEVVLGEYAAACRIYGCHHRINAGILTTFRFRLPYLRVSGSFHDADMLALAEVLLRRVNGALSYIRRLDFSVAASEGRQLGWKGFRSHGAYALSRVLQVSRHVEEVFLPNNKIGPYGASAIFCAARSNPTLRTLLMRGCRIGERGAFAFVSQVLAAEGSENGGAPPRCGLKEVDLSANRIGFYGVFAVEKGMKSRMELLEPRQGDGGAGGAEGDNFLKRPLPVMEVDLEGNMVFQEVMNCVTHGLGILLAVIGTFLLSNRVRGRPDHYVLSCGIYSTSLIVLYLSSTLFHSFFALQRVRYIFRVFDLCAIYILIAGSYTPFLLIAMHHKPTWSRALLAFIWVCGAGGIGVEAMLPLWKHKATFSLAMYLGMGWSCLICMPNLLAVLPVQALYFLVAGGVAYTAGVPFFVRNNNLDHSIWHCFVLAGSIFHWLCVYLYVVNL